MSLVIPSIFTAIDKFSGPLKTMRQSVHALVDSSEGAAARLTRSLNKMSERAFDISRNTGIAGAAITAPLAYATHKAIEFEDRMADIAKTTGLQGKPLDDFGKALRRMSHNTRTSINDLATIGEIGGRLGVAKNELLSFTAASDKFSIALASDYAGGVEEAITSVSKLKNLFQETRNIRIAEAITRTGSAINELGGHGFGTSQNINDFMLRMGALPDVMKPAITDTAALGGFFEKFGIDSQIASSGLSNLLKVANENLGKFANQMHISRDAAAQLFKQSPTEFVKQFSTSLKGLPADQMAAKLKDLGVGSLEVNKVIGVLISGTEQLTEIQKMASSAFANGTSLQEEAAKKNATLAAKMEQARNIFADLAITVGEKLIPPLSKLIDKVSPIISGVVEWMDKHQQLTSFLAIGAGVLGSVLLVISGVSFAIGTVTKMTAAWEVVQGILNGTMKMNPIGLVITAIGLLVTAIIWVVKNVEGWGEQWDSIVTWMKDVMKVFVLAMQLQFQVLAGAFFYMVDQIVIAWKWGQNLIGKLSDEQFAKDKARIEKEQKMRVDAAKQTAIELAATTAKVSTGPVWKLHMAQQEEKAQAATETVATIPTETIDRRATQSSNFAQNFEAIKSSGTVDVNINNNTGYQTTAKTSGTLAPNVSFNSTLSPLYGKK